MAVCHPEAMSRADVSARAVAEELGLADVPIDPEKTAGSLDLIVVRQNADAGVDGMLLRRDGRVVIGLNDTRPPEGQRFTLAHLVGHYRMHARRELILDGIVRYEHRRLACIPTDREEVEANRFAGALLMPEHVVRRMAREADFDTAAQLVDLLAPRFEVSRAVMSVMSYRLMSLGIILDV
jgi:Zn-dependent peptidase ImmA (M78 family)